MTELVNRLFCCLKFKDKIMVRNDEHAKRLIQKRADAGKKGLPNAVKRYMKRTGFNPFPFSNEIQD